MPIDSSVVAEIARHLNGRTAGLVWQSNRGTPLRLNSVLKWQLKPILKKLGITFPTRNGMHAFRHGRISYLAYSGVTFAVIREWVGHGSDAISNTTWQDGRPTTRRRWRNYNPWLDPFAPKIMKAMATKLPCWNQMEPNRTKRRLAQKPRSPL